MALPPDPNVEVGIIGVQLLFYGNLSLGMGDMGRMYARLISKAGWKCAQIHCAI